MDDKLTDALSNLEEKTVLALVKERIEAGQDPLVILKACQDGMLLVGKRYEACEYFISDLMLAGEIFKQVADMLSPRLKGVAARPRVTRRAR